MHSSRMRTGRSLTVCWRLLPRGGVCLVPGGLPCRGVSAWLRGCLSGPEGDVCLVWGGVSGPGGVCLVWGGGVGLWSGGLVLWDLGGAGIPACTEADTPPLWDRITDACKKHYLGPTSLRPVIMFKLFVSEMLFRALLISCSTIT